MSTTTTRTDTESQVEMQIDDIDLTGGGGGGKECEWSDSICDETPTNYTVSFYDDPDCRQRHTTYYCPRHYVLMLDRIIHHITNCPGYDECTTPEEFRRCTLEHIADFGSIQ